MRSLAIRAHPLVFGVVLFLASELMFFAGLFAAYFDLRSETAVWPPAGVHLNLPEATLGTLILALSSVLMLRVSALLARESILAARAWLIPTMLLAVTFLCITLHGWAHNTFSIGSNAYGSIFYAMTGFHALHVTVGLLLLAALFIGMRSGAMREQHRAGAEAIIYYWHFVFIVWAGIWGSIYLIR